MKSFKQLLALTLSGKKKAPNQVYPDKEINVADDVKNILNKQIKTKFKQSVSKDFLGEQVPNSSLDILMDNLPSKLFISDLPYKPKPNLKERMDKENDKVTVPQEPDSAGFTSKEDKEVEFGKRKKPKSLKRKHLQSKSLKD